MRRGRRSGARAAREGRASRWLWVPWKHPVSCVTSLDVSLCARARRYGFAALGTGVRTVPLAAEGPVDGSGGFPRAPAGASAELTFVVELALLGCGALVPRDAWMTYCGVRRFHHAARPENQPCAAGGCRFPSYAG